MTPSRKSYRVQLNLRQWAAGGCQTLLECEIAPGLLARLSDPEDGTGQIVMVLNPPNPGLEAALDMTAQRFELVFEEDCR